MRLTHLSLTNFRNFIRLERQLPSGPTLLVGDNAQGKTSLLEAIYYLAGATSPHTTSDRQLINFLSLEEPLPVSRLVAEVERADRLQRVEIRLIVDPETDGRLRKEILINGLKRRVSELASVFNAVLFLPQDLQVLEGSPGGRRRFLDAVISQADPFYGQALTDYGKALSQRNALLKNLQESRPDGQQLEVWEAQLAEHGAEIVRGRALALHELETLAQPVHRQLTRQQETLRLVYLPSYDPLPAPEGQLGFDLDTPLDRTTVGADEIRHGLADSLRRSRPAEIQRGATLTGPHRDDFAFVANGLNLQLYGSRGQSRTAVLAAKLAEVDWLRQRTGEWPVLLLDEVLAELDAARRADLLARVEQVHQSVLTAADREMFTDEFCQRATLWRVRAGSLELLSD
jgi:DNA replication and repair protein RecF